MVCSTTRPKPEGPVSRHISVMRADDAKSRPYPEPVILIGPPTTEMGGMASVVRQTLALDYAGRFRPELVPITLSSDPRELLFGRCVRHSRQLRHLRTTIRRSGARLIHIHTCSGKSFYRSVIDLVLARRLGCRVVLHIHGAKFDEFVAREPRWRRRIVSWALAHADRVISLSRAWHKKIVAIAPQARVVVVENAVDIPPVAPPPRSATGCHFLLLARMDEWKGIDDLLAACALLHNSRVTFELTLAGPPGTAGDSESLQRKIDTLSLEACVKYVGSVAGDAKRALLAWADVYVQPSHHEGMPIAVLEAMAASLPVIATRVGGMPEMLSDGRCGLITPPRDPQGLADAMDTLASDPPRRIAMAQAARASALSRFSTQRLHSDLLNLYDDLIPHRKSNEYTATGQRDEVSAEASATIREISLLTMNAGHVGQDETLGCVGSPSRR